MLRYPVFEAATAEKYPNICASRRLLPGARRGAELKKGWGYVRTLQGPLDVVEPECQAQREKTATRTETAVACILQCVSFMYSLLLPMVNFTAGLHAGLC